MELREDELPDFLKHLFFFHRLYALFGDAAKCHDFMPFAHYKVSHRDIPNPSFVQLEFYII